MVDTISASYFVGIGVILMSHLSSILYPLVHCITLESHFALINLNRFN